MPKLRYHQYHKTNPFHLRIQEADYTRRAQHDDVYRLLGLDPKKHLPKEGIPPQDIQGITVWVTPANEPVLRHGVFRTYVGSSKHRVMAECPACKRQMSVGRLFQHKCERS